MVRVVLLLMVVLAVASLSVFWFVADFDRQRFQPKRLSDLLAPIGDPLAALVSSAEQDRIDALKPFRKAPSRVASRAPLERVFNHSDVPRDFLKQGGQFRELSFAGRLVVVFEPLSVVKRLGAKAQIPTPVPLVLAFHDANSSAWQLALHRCGFAKRASRHNFVAAFLQANDPDPVPTFDVDLHRTTKAAWRTALSVDETDMRDDIAFTSTVLDDLLLRYSVDRRQVFAVGFGSGAVFAVRAALFFATTWASVVLVGGGLDDRVTPGPWAAERLPPLLIITKRGDAQRHLAQEARDLFRGANGEAKLIELSESASLRTYNSTLEEHEIMPFLTTHRLVNG